MIPNLSIYISLAFGITTIATLVFFNWTIRNSTVYATQKKAIAILLLQVVWLIVQAVLALNDIYNTNLKMFPPRLFLFGLLPPFLCIIVLFISKNGRGFIDSLPLKQLTFLNTVRIPVEIILFCLFLKGAIPQLMTFEGGNLDILSGLSALAIGYFGFVKRVMNRKLILAWNFICLALLINIVFRALLSAPFPFQKLGFDHPNIGILNFPFIWLPTFIVPLVFFGHLTSIRKLLALTLEENKI